MFGLQDLIMEETQENQSRWNRFKERSQDEYQLVVRNTHNYHEIGSYNLTPLNVYAALSTLFLVVAVIVIGLIAFTPLRQYVPGYGDVVQREEMADLQYTVGELTEIVDGQNLYIENLKRTLLGKVITADSVEKRTEIVASEEVDPLPPSEAEIQLRRDMEQERMAVPAAMTVSLPSPGSNDVTLASVYLVAPLNGEVSAGFNLATDHTGVDILAPQNTAVKATREGIVFLSEYSNANGNMIGIQHDNNLISFYKHNSKLLKEVGDRVKAGEAIAIIGNTGTQSTGPHLHFELWHQGRAVDPGEFVSF